MNKMDYATQEKLLANRRKKFQVHFVEKINEKTVQYDNWLYDTWLYRVPQLGENVLTNISDGDNVSGKVVDVKVRIIDPVGFHDETNTEDCFEYYIVTLEKAGE